jgi:hypothetical protein
MSYRDGNQSQAAAGVGLHILFAAPGLHGLTVPAEENDDVPEWWVEELRQAMNRMPRADGRPGPGRDIDLAHALIHPGLSDADKVAALNAAKVRVHRFLEGKSRSAKTVELLRVTLGLPKVHFTASGPEASRAMEIAAAEPSKVLAALVREDDAQRRIREAIEKDAADRVMKSAESGANRMLGDESEDGSSHGRTVEVSDEDGTGKRRGRGGARVGAPTSAKK